MRRSSLRRCLVLCIFGMVAYVGYRVSSSVLGFGLEDIRDRADLQSRVQRQSGKLVTVKGHKAAGVSPSGQACRHPDLDPKEPTLYKFFTPSHPIVCDDEPDWVCVSGGKAQVCNSTLKRFSQVKCDYTFLKRVTDFSTEDGESVQSEGPTKLKSDFFKVTCKNNEGSHWSDIMAGIKFDPEIHQRAGKEKLPNDALGLNIIMWGFDSLSRMTFMRKLPKTYSFLVDTVGAVVLKGYNIVGDGTPQALIPILTGKTELELPETRKRMADKAQHVNVYPFIWKDFQDHGYVTAYAEDCPSIGTFTYRLKGFDEQPTDHYMRAFYVAAEEQYSDHKDYCLRAVPRHEVLMNWIREFVTMYSEEPKFAFAFHSELSHDDYNKVGSTDDDFHELLKFLRDGGHLNNTVLIVMSDHGHRFAHIRETQQGKQEERLPFFSFTFPPWFEQKYPIAMTNFRQNAERLTSPFDIYPTLYNILHFEGPGMGNIKDRSISLFKEIPLTRTCQDADIEPHWCACLNWEPVAKDDEAVVKAANALVKFVNELTEPEREICEVLTLDKIVWAGKFIPTKGLLQYKKNADYDGFVADLSDQTSVSAILYQVKIHTQPGEGHFEASLKYETNKKVFVIKTEDISRVNKYGRAAECVEGGQEQLRKFCYCKTPVT